MALVQIKTIPAWHQSTELLTSCPTLYIESVIRNNAQPGGMDSARGKQIHRAAAGYSAYCALKRVGFDLRAFDEFAAGAGPVAAKILSGMRETFDVDWEHFLAAELQMSLDANFLPTSIAESVSGTTCTDSEQEPVIIGTLDSLYSFPERAMMRIDDYKSHPRPFNPGDTLQAKTYALFVFLHWAWVQTVVFRLIFVRYPKVTREVEFNRGQVGELMDAVKSARERQVKIHQDYEAGLLPEALAGPHCLYCPLLSNGKCPIAQWNPNMQLTPEQRLNFNLWYAQFSRVNNAAMKAYVQEKGRPIVLKDYNGKAYTYGPVEKESEVYPVFQFGADGMQYRSASNPVLPIIDLLIDYAADNAADSTWMANVTISSTSLKKYLKAKKRAFLDQAVQDTAGKITKVSLRVSKPLDTVPEEEDDEDEWDEEEEL